MPPRTILLASLAACLVAAGCQSPAPTTLTVFAAASLTDAFGVIGQRFQEQHPGINVAFNFAGSQQLAQQLAQGAPADVFASADQDHMDAAVNAGRVAAGASAAFAANHLVVVYPPDNPGVIARLQDLARPGLRIVLAAPNVPAGRYSLEFLAAASRDPAFGARFKDEVLANVVSQEQDVRAALAKVVLGEADAGIVYSTDAGGANANKVSRIEIPDALNVTAVYPIAPVRDAAQPDLARAFVELVLSAQGQGILSQYGFIPAPGARP